MSVRIQLDDPTRSYTNLDSIGGRVVLNLNHDESISAIVVKLEGESRSFIARAPTAFEHSNPSLVAKEDQRAGLATENHKILYEISQVFPIQNVTAADGNATDPVYTLKAGQHEYPFKLKIPLHNRCSHLPSQQKRPNYDPGTFWEKEGRPQLPYRHVKRVLPPSLAGFGIEAEVRYYLKVTVQRPSRFKGNRRSEHPFRFIPFDPPKIPTSSKEVYARRPYVFQTGPSGEVDGRLPSPAVLTWDQNIPLRIVLRKSDENEEQIYLKFLQFRLFDFTEIRASDVLRVRTNSWIILSLEGLAIPIWAPSKNEMVLNSKLWDRVPLPSTVEPSFETCNLRRTYDLEVGVGLGYIDPQNERMNQTEIFFVPLRFQVDIFSGRDASSSTSAIQFDDHLPPTYDSSSRPETNATEEVDLDDVLPGYEDAMRSSIGNAPIGDLVGREGDVADLKGMKGKSAE